MVYIYTSTGSLLLAFMLLEQLFKVPPCNLVQDLAGMLSFSFCQMTHDLKVLTGKDEAMRKKFILMMTIAFLLHVRIDQNMNYIEISSISAV